MEALRAVRGGVQGSAGAVCSAGKRSKSPPLRRAQGRLCLSKERRDKDGAPKSGSNGEVTVSAFGCLRSLSEVFTPVQHSRCARRDFGDWARGRDCTRAGAGCRNCEGLGGSAEERSSGGTVRRACACR